MVVVTGVTVTVVVISLALEVVVDTEPVAVTAVWACCPLPKTVTMYFCPGTMAFVGTLPWKRANPPIVTGPL